MMKHLSLLMGASLFLGTVVAAQPPAAGPSIAPPTLDKSRQRDLAAQVPLLQTWWVGQYDNHEQIVRQSGGGISSPLYAPFHRLHTAVTALAAPGLGAHVLALTQYADDNPDRISRRELLVLVPDARANAIRVKRYRADDALALTDPAVAAALQPSSLKPLDPGCDLLLRFAGGQFEGALAGACPVPVARVNYNLIVGQRFMWERAIATDAHGKPSWEMAPGAGFEWYQETRARPFTCNVFEDPRGQMATAKFFKTIHLHDQGGEAQLDWPDGRKLVFAIHNRAFTSTPEREYPLFRIEEKGNPVPLAYAYAVDETKRFGLNLGWFYVRCYEDGDMSPIDMVEAKK